MRVFQPLTGEQVTDVRRAYTDVGWHCIYVCGDFEVTGIYLEWKHGTPPVFPDLSRFQLDRYMVLR